MREPRWLSKPIVIAIHDESLTLFGGASGIRDDGMLESALARPQQKWHYAPETSLFGLAASYGFGLVRNHPFVDGNKRIGLLAIQAFLHVNGHAFDPNQNDEVRTILALAAGEIAEDALTAWIAENSKPLG